MIGKVSVEGVVIGVVVHFHHAAPDIRRADCGRPHAPAQREPTALISAEDLIQLKFEA